MANRKKQRQGFSIHNTILFASDDKIFLKRIKTFTSKLHLKIYFYDNDYTEFIGVPYFVAVIDRSLLETEEWDFILNKYRPDADDKTTLLIVDKLDLPVDRYCKFMNKDQINKIFIHLYKEYVKIRIFKKIREIEKYICLVKSFFSKKGKYLNSD